MLSSLRSIASRRVPACIRQSRVARAQTLRSARTFSTRGGYNALKSSQQVSHKEWVATPEELDQERLDIDGHPVMQRWETPYMGELAKVATSQGGRVLEVGFGMGISASAVQRHPIAEHLIIEANADVFKRLQGFAATAPHLVTPVGPGLWQDSISQIPDGSLDGVLYDTYPLVKEEQHTHQFDFIGRAYGKLREGGILTYCNLTSLGVLRGEYASWEELFEKSQLPYLIKCGFREQDIDFKIVGAAPTADCEYYQHDTALVPICYKRTGAPGVHRNGAANGHVAESSPVANNAAYLDKLNGSALSEQVAVRSNPVKRARARLAALEAKLKEAEDGLAEAEAELARAHANAATQKDRKVNAWTQWGKLKEVVVGVADHACFIPPQPAMQPAINPEGGSGATDHKNDNAGGIIEAELPWPTGPKKQETIQAANAQLDNLARVLQERGIHVMRPDPTMDWSQPLQTPFFSTPHQYCSTCGRDSLITLGNIVMEAAVSRRDRYFEVMAYRDIIAEMRAVDEDMMWKAAPKPTLRDEMYNETWWNIKQDERYERMHSFEFCVTEDEPVFDAADITRCGKDIFMQLSMTCNKAGIDWLRKELKPHGFRVHMVRFPYDLAPSHLDCTFVPLRPGLVLTNPDRPIMEEDAELFKKNGWRFITAPEPKNPIRPWASQSSKWLSMNVLVIGPNEVVVEEQETPLHDLLESEGFEVIKVPFRDVYEFGGGLHCATWDISRDDKMDDFFPNQ